MIIDKTTDQRMFYLKDRLFTGRTDAEVPIIWPPDKKSRLTGKDSDAGKDRRQKKRVEEDEIVREHH